MVSVAIWSTGLSRTAQTITGTQCHTRLGERAVPLEHVDGEALPAVLEQESGATSTPYRVA